MVWFDSMASCGGSMLATNMSVEAAVDEWIMHYPCLKELADECIWFRPMMEVIGTRLLYQVAWGAKARVIASASLGIADMVTDIFLIYEVRRSE